MASALPPYTRSPSTRSRAEEAGQGLPPTGRLASPTSPPSLPSLAARRSASVAGSRPGTVLAARHPEAVRFVVSPCSEWNAPLRPATKETAFRAPTFNAVELQKRLDTLAPPVKGRAERAYSNPYDNAPVKEKISTRRVPTRELVSLLRELRRASPHKRRDVLMSERWTKSQGAPRAASSLG